MSEEINKKVNQLRAFFKKNQAENHPIKNHPLNECEDYVKELYFDMLCVMAQYENEDIENQNKFIQRIMAGCNETMPIAEHIKRAMSLTVENIAEFLKQCRDNELSDIFFMDCLIISCGNGTPNKKQVEFLAEIADVLGFDKNKVKFMSELAVAVLEQDFEKLKSAVTSYDELKCETENTSCYVQPIVDMNVVSTDKKKIFYSLKLTEKPLFEVSENIGDNVISEGDINYIEFSNIDQIIFENKYITTPLKFTSVKSVVFRNCTIDNSSGHFYFNSVGNVTIEKCFFKGTGDTKNYNGGVLYLEQCNDIPVKIVESKFINYKLDRNCNSGCRGGVIYSSDGLSDINLKKCEFNDCEAYYGAITYECNVVIDGCYFSNCKGSDCFHQRRNIFGQISTSYNKGESENKFIGCCSEIY